LIENDVAKATGAAKPQVYQAAEPYHHTCIDNFLHRPVLERVLAELDTLPEPEEGYSRAQENLKFSYILDNILDNLSSYKNPSASFRWTQISRPPHAGTKHLVL
jgi:hypothetical protein